ncbi:TFIIB-type zinc ribbon-containing protein [Breznakiellaceae bacterium SP9]
MADAAMEYKCPNCGGTVSFDIKNQSLTCDFCGTVIDTAVLQQYNEDLKKPVAKDAFEWAEPGSADWQEKGLSVMSCKSCGGELIVDSTTSSTKCPYCDTPVVITGQLSGALKPDCIIPFKVDKKAAVKALEGFMEGKPLLPSLFKSQNRIESICGVYVPFWLFDCKAHGNIRYKATNVKTWSDNDYRYVKTDTYQVFREGDVSFEKIPVDGSKKMDDTYMEAIEPFNYQSLEPFQSAYLMGYLAEKYDVDSAQSKERANKRIKSSTEQLLTQTVTGYTSVTMENSSVQFAGGACRYALLPVWMLNTKYQGETYTFAMNGQTGKLIGKLPIDNGKYFRRLLGFFALFTAITSAIVYFL